MQGRLRRVRLLQAFYPIHIGSVGGLPLRAAYVLLGLVPALLAGTGIYLLWSRRKRERSRGRRSSSFSERVEAAP